MRVDIASSVPNSLLEGCEVLGLVVVLQRHLTGAELALFVLGPQVLRVELDGTLGVRPLVVFHQLGLGELPDEGARLAAPDLAGGDESASRHD